MKKLDEKEWKEFTLGEIFNNFHGRRLNINERQPGKIPMLTAGDADNGVSAFISNRNMPIHENFISIDMFGSSFYHPYTATGDDNIYFFENDTLANDTKRFISAVIEKQSLKFSYGKQFRQKNADTLRIMLPVDDDGKPDYDYMAQYTSKMRKRMLMRYRNYVAGQLSKLEYKDIPALDEKEWKSIAIASIFSLVRGRESNMAMLGDGDVPLISAKNSSNGLKGFVDTPNKLIHGGCITLNNDGDGGAGLAYYQPANMALDTHVTALIPEFEMSNWAMLFIAECISGLHGFFGHGLSISNARAKNVRVMLPVDDDGEPDYAYMAQYTKNLMLRKYKQFLRFLDRAEGKVK